MIAQLRGQVVERAVDRVILDCGGVGYELFVSSRTLAKVPGTDEEMTLHSRQIVREDALTLYGFASAEERELFDQLISVAGVGPKMAIAALSGSPVRELRLAIAASDSKRFEAVPGIGRKTAERIIVELREKMSEALAAGPPGSASGEHSDAKLLAREGLVTLGYGIAEAQTLLDSIPDDADIAEPEELIAAALREAVGAA